MAVMQRQLAVSFYHFLLVCTTVVQKKLFPLVSSSIPFLLCLPHRSLPPLVNCPNIPVIGCLCLLDSSLGSVHPGPDTSSEDCVSLSCRRTLRALSLARAPSLLSAYLPLSLYHSLSLSLCDHAHRPSDQPTTPQQLKISLFPLQVRSHLQRGQEEFPSYI